jgi:cytochrome c peroxidase
VTSTSIPLDSAILNGKILFNTSNRTSIAKDRWVSCATCHPDGGTDGRTWQFRDGPRNTPPLFGSGDSLPAHWSGDLDELQDVESTVRNIQAGTGLAPGADNCDPACNGAALNAGRSKDLDDLAAFMRILRPPPAPAATSDAFNRGRSLFFDSRTQCASCHPAPLYADKQKHDVGTGRGPNERKGTSFDTPSLRGLADSSPYFHDGSAETLIDIVRGATGQHGNTTGLTEAEKSDLAEFLKLIPFASPKRRSAGR